MSTINGINVKYISGLSKSRKKERETISALYISTWRALKVGRYVM